MTADVSRSSLKRDVHPIPEDVALALSKSGLSKAYDARPPYQRNDYIGWISRAKRPATRAKRINQMVDQVEKGGIYMSMRWNGGEIA